MTREDDKGFKKPYLLNVGFVINVCVEGDVKVRDHCDITEKYSGSAHKECNINVKLNHKITVVFHNITNNDSHLIMQEVGKFDFKINVMANGLEKYISFNINFKLNHELSSSLESVVTNLGKNDFKYLSQEFDSSKVIDFVKQKRVSI